jgi:hypothetical protein
MAIDQLASNSSLSLVLTMMARNACHGGPTGEAEISMLKARSKCGHIQLDIPGFSGIAQPCS